MGSNRKRKRRRQHRNKRPRVGDLPLGFGRRTDFRGRQVGNYGILAEFRVETEDHGSTRSSVKPAGVTEVARPETWTNVTKLAG